MSYYPDADEIRMAYVSHNKSDAYGSDAETLKVEFNRWFEYEQSKVVLATEERIIKVLEELHADKNQQHHIEKPSGVCVTCRALAKILEEAQ